MAIVFPVLGGFGQQSGMRMVANQVAISRVADAGQSLG
jgi:hypothetical protein